MTMLPQTSLASNAEVFSDLSAFSKLYSSAVMDGVTDNVATIQAEINLLSALGGGTIYFKPGTAVVGTPGLDMKANVTLEGSGREEVTKLIRSGSGATYPILSALGDGGDLVGDGLIKRCRFVNLTFDGADAAATLMDIRGAAIWEFYNVKWRASFREAILFWNVWDTRFYNCRVDSSGSLDGTYPAIDLRSGDDGTTVWYTTNNIHFISCVFEGNRGKVLRGLGQAGLQTSELYFIATKIENLDSNVSGQIELNYCSTVEFLGVQFAVAGTAGNTLTEALKIVNTGGVFGDIIFYHTRTVAVATYVDPARSSATPTGASINRIATITTSAQIDLKIHPRGYAVDKLQETAAVTLSGANVDVYVAVLPDSNTMLKAQVTPAASPQQMVDTLLVRGPNAGMGIVFQSIISGVNSGRYFSLGRLGKDGNNNPVFYFMHNNGGGEATLMQLSHERDLVFQAAGIRFTSSAPSGIAATGSTQGTAAALSKQPPNNKITSATAGSADGVILPVGNGSSQLVIVQNETAVDVKVYPPSSGAIGGGTVNAPVTLAAHTSAIFIGTTIYNYGRVG